MSNSVELQITGLSPIDAEELAEDVGEENVTIRRGEQNLGHDLGILGVDDVVIILLGAAAINGVSLWLAKRHMRKEEVEKLKIEKKADGSQVIEYVHTKTHKESAPPDAASIAAITTKLNDLAGTLQPPV